MYVWQGYSMANHPNVSLSYYHYARICFQLIAHIHGTMWGAMVGVSPHSYQSVILVSFSHSFAINTRSE